MDSRDFVAYDHFYTRLRARRLGDTLPIQDVRRSLRKWRMDLFHSNIDINMSQLPATLRPILTERIRLLNASVFLEHEDSQTDEQERSDFKRTVGKSCELARSALTEWKNESPRAPEPKQGPTRLPSALLQLAIQFCSFQDLAVLSTCSSSWLDWVWIEGAAFLTTWEMIDKPLPFPWWLMSQSRFLTRQNIVFYSRGGYSNGGSIWDFATQYLQYVTTHAVYLQTLRLDAPGWSDAMMANLSRLPASCREVIFIHDSPPWDTLQLPPTVLRVKFENSRDRFTIATFMRLDIRHPSCRCMIWEAMCLRPKEHITLQICDNILSVTRQGQTKTYKVEDVINAHDSKFLE